MEDSLTRAVLDVQAGKVELMVARNLAFVEIFQYFQGCRGRNEDDVSEFLLSFQDRLETLIRRFRYQGLPFRHYLMRSIKWRWTSFLSLKTQAERLDELSTEPSFGAETCAEPEHGWEFRREFRAVPSVPAHRWVLLTLKAAPQVDDEVMEEVCRHSGTDLSWLQACQHRLCRSASRRLHRWKALADRRREAFFRRVVAEDSAREALDPVSRGRFEDRAHFYRQRLGRIHRDQAAATLSPTHLEISRLLGMPKGSVDSGLHHLKKKLACVYHGDHEDSLGHQQRP